MSLNWNIEDIEDWEEFHEDDQNWQITQAMIWETMGVDIGTITEDNWSEFYARSILLGDIGHKPMYGPDGPRHFTADEVRRRIGLRTNVVNKTRTQFLKRVTYKLDEIKRQAEREAHADN